MNKRKRQIATAEDLKEAQSGENLTAQWIDENTVEFQINEKAFIITTTSDLTALSKNSLEELDSQLYYYGECDDPQIRQLKFCAVRKHIQATLNRRN